ncbi:MAG TPA: hypothetical protein VMA36_12365 [Candidatus Limnocylindria bacterium]|jgi:hypothetical protein|nr:hypothetical protein [Candidatus Limnocylindria bacterium]
MMFANRFGRAAAALALAGTALFATVGTASAQWWPGTPPPPRYERHAVRAGYGWEPGHYRWNGVRWVWIPGYEVRGPWVPGHWVYGPNGRRWIPGHRI